MKDFKEKLKELRKRDNLSQIELAQKLSLDNSTISKWERGINEPNIDMLQRIADYFNISIDELCGYSVESFFSSDELNKLKKIYDIANVKDMNEEQYKEFLKTAEIIAKGLKK